MPTEENFMANEPLNETAPGPAENRETTASPTPSPAASSPVAKPAKSAPAGRKKTAAKARPRSTAKRSKAPAERRSASGTRPPRQASIAVAAAPAAALPRATAGRTGIGITVADLVESNARSYVSAQEQIAAAARGTWLASVAKLNARVVTQVAEAQADLARRLLG
jgi:hypothetical protein